MTADEYKRRFIEHLKARMVGEGMQPEEDAATQADEWYEACPYEETATEWVDDPEGAADEAYAEWADAADDIDDIDYYELNGDTSEPLGQANWDDDDELPF